MILPKIMRVGYNKKSLLSKIQEKLVPNPDIRQIGENIDKKINSNVIVPASFENKNPNDLVIDSDNHLVTNRNYSRDLMKNFSNKTLGLGDKPSIAHDITKSTDTYPNKKDQVYK